MQARLDATLTRRDLAKAVGVTSADVRAWERGDEVPTVTPIEVAHHSAIPGHLGLIAMLTGRKIKWNPKKEVIIGDEEANRLVNQPMRAPWHL